MAFKTITIDLEAYELLRSGKSTGQSFSQVIKSRMKRGGTGLDLAAALDRLAVEETTLDAVERVVKSRRRSPARRPAL